MVAGRSGSTSEKTVYLAWEMFLSLDRRLFMGSSSDSQGFLKAFKKVK